MTLLPRKIRAFVNRFFTLHDTPQRIAGGAAVGVFMGIVPFEGFTMAFLVTTLLHLNRSAALITVAAANVWATAALLIPSAWIGSLLFRTNPSELVSQSALVIEKGWEHLFSPVFLFGFALPLTVGYVIVALAMSTLCYFFLLYSLQGRLNPNRIIIASWYPRTPRN